MKTYNIQLPSTVLATNNTAQTRTIWYLMVDAQVGMRAN